jgi:hypothetical protein
MKAIRLYGSRGTERVVLEQIPVPELGAGSGVIDEIAPAYFPTTKTKPGKTVLQISTQ